MDNISLGLGLEGSHVLVTGGAGLIGRVVVDHFIAAGAKVSSLDIVYPSISQQGSAPSDTGHPALIPVHCDVSNETEVHQAFATAVATHGPVDVVIALASLDLSVLRPRPFADASFDQLRAVLNTNVAGTWLTAREWTRGLRQARHSGTPMRHPNLIIVGSESGLFGERYNAEYSLGKSAVQGGLLHSLRMDVPKEWPGARVNVIAPGPVRTERWEQECEQNPDQYYLEAQATTALGEPVPVKAVAMTILSVASHNFSSHVHGQVIAVDGGKQGKVVWTQDVAPKPYE
ncbi:NAD-P-binding protein [Boeremia exigua]|uniref:NAD-P-binding protein n=1 Tax=Boeremia exigua TaxID=749465 RepID=UPI001E8D1A3E|nr:NAD-P-binding protein [Boeremia exigua]KAH6639027.1 NAD-P-binding protein [Boeremia exigua]